MGCLEITHNCLLHSTKKSKFPLSNFNNLGNALIGVLVLSSAQELLKKRQALVDNLVKLLGLYIPPLDNLPLKRGGDAVCAW